MVASRIRRRRSRCAAEPRSSRASEFEVKIWVLCTCCPGCQVRGLGTPGTIASSVPSPGCGTRSVSATPTQATNVVGHNRNTFQLRIVATPPQRRGGPLRIALVSYRSKPHCGGQGVYVRHLSRELTALGHTVEVFSGQPYPELDEGVGLTKVPSLDLYREPDPFRIPKFREFRDLIDVEEFLTMCVAGFPEPKTFSSRVAKLLK